MPERTAITRRADGRYVATIQMHGKRRFIYGKSEREVRGKLAEVQRQTIVVGTLATPGRRTVNDLLDSWLDVCRTTLKPRAVKNYTETARLYVRPALGHVKLARLDPTHIQGLYATLASRELSRAPALSHAVLHRACRVGVLWGWLGANPCDRVIPPRYRAPHIQVWTAEQAAHFLASTLDGRHGPLFAFLIFTGTRIGEATALTWEDVDARRVTIRSAVHRIEREWVTSAPKTEAGRRVLTLFAAAQDVVRVERVRQAERRLKVGSAWVDRGLVFSNDHGNVLHPSMVAHALRDTCDHVGLPRLTPHKLRHLCASLLLAENVPLPNVSRRLGHAHPGITARLYAHVVRGDEDAASAQERVLTPRIREEGAGAE